MKSDKKGIRKIIAALFFSLSGLRVCIRYEISFRQILVICSFLLVIAYFLGNNFIEVFILCVPLFFMVFAELINTAIEKVVDLVSPDFHPLARDAKDIGSSLQFVSMVFGAIVWSSYLLDRFVFID